MNQKIIVKILIAYFSGMLASGLENLHAQSAQIEPHTLLLLDDFYVVYRPGTKRVLHPVRRHSHNPMIHDDKPWEKTIGYCSVHHNPDTGLYQLWYQALAPVSPESTNVCYAESKDGVL